MNPLLLLAGAAALYVYSRPRRRKEQIIPKRRNPAPTRAALTQAERNELSAARRLSEEFHGTDSQVIELGQRERQLPRFVVALGKIPELAYQPNAASDKGTDIYVHEAGDRGPFRTRARQKPLLAADPRTRRPLIVPMRSPVVFEADKGLIG